MGKHGEIYLHTVVLIRTLGRNRATFYSVQKVRGHIGNNEELNADNECWW